MRQTHSDEETLYQVSLRQTHWDEETLYQVSYETDTLGQGDSLQREF